MKPRPTSILDMLVLPARPRPQLYLRGSACIRPTRVSFGAGWEDKRWKCATQLRCASTSTSSTASKTRYGSNMQPPPPTKASSKTSTGGVPAKQRTTLPVGRHAATAPAATAPAETRPALRYRLSILPDKINPPPYTHAPPLKVPERKEGQNRASWLLKCGKAYLNFYKTGVSHTRQTLKLAKQIRNKLADQGKGISADEPGNGILSRSEWQVLQRSRRDLLRLPIMGLLVIVLGEWLPLVAIYLTPLIPEPCRIPYQVSRTLRKLEKKRKYRLNTIATHALRLQNSDRTPATDEHSVRLAAAAEGIMDPETKVGKSGGIPMSQAIVPPSASADLSLYHLLLLSARLDCHPRILDTLYLTPPKWLLQRSVGKKLAYLAEDDWLIQRDGGVQRLEKEELQRACVERGIDVLEKSEGEQRRLLSLWYKM